MMSRFVCQNSHKANINLSLDGSICQTSANEHEETLSSHRIVQLFGEEPFGVRSMIKCRQI